ncbi:hypothetical protein TVAG_105000 [Trichomonas vaginalis G3]|uniref:Uncharacterized protein n=1 Tax=Trichomonas vaginalis (strain ATCC PRA-98 / G3) TaxID=412133 RepID=A2FH59_TRIV3|nr:hypothetical protein TVAGG3_0301620 [Trichomonas vaginalis G3]EAX95741.1 hypothetical protein TVAG_105000 [Trichomonas vaginalis G3]KAI5527932.1 hypothetical protein TVAGG3_0301620 [Trichomonas vaginalis G3]|eukprot:XP_001308671.1 hypothetical protein [Trichomonas vaginalis G3]
MLKSMILFPALTFLRLLFSSFFNHFSPSRALSSIDLITSFALRNCAIAFAYFTAIFFFSSSLFFFLVSPTSTLVISCISCLTSFGTALRVFPTSTLVISYISFLTSFGTAVLVLPTSTFIIS